MNNNVLFIALFSDSFSFGIEAKWKLKFNIFDSPEAKCVTNKYADIDE